MKISAAPTDAQSSPITEAVSTDPPTLLNLSVRRIALRGVLLLAVFMLVMGVIQFSTPDMPDNDGYYHIKYASLMRIQGLKPDFPWLQLTILNAREFSDHHFLFHIALIPFTFGDLRIGAKWAAVFFSSLAFLCIWGLLYQQKVPHSTLWALGVLAVSEAFLYRMSITRAQSLSLAFLALGLHWLLTGKYKWLLPLAFFYVWLYDAFPLILAVTACYILAIWIIERRLDLRPMVYVALGLGLGLIINPYFPYNLIFLYRHLVPKLSDATAVSVGSEWYPYTTVQLLKNSPVTWVALLGGILAIGLNPRSMDTRTATSLFLVGVFGLMLFEARRFIEYFPAFVLIFTAFTWSPLLENDQMRTGRFLVKFPKWGKRGGEVSSGMFSWNLLFVGGFALVLLPLIGSAVLGARSAIMDSQPYTRYASASQWLASNTPAGSRVFQTDWDDFPRLFFYNTHNTYLVGLDPTYMQLYNSQLYGLWVQITQGKKEPPSNYIYTQFGATYALSDLLHRDFINQASRDPGLRQVYRDQEAVIYQVLNPNQ